jgi:predicted aspartyl protease
VRRRLLPLLAVGVALTGCGGGSSAPRSSVRDRGVTVKVVLSQGADGALAVVPVQVGRKGYGFIVDTGASQTSVDSSVVAAARLPKAGKRQTQTTVGCTTSSQPVALRSWALQDLTLPPITATSEHTDLAARSHGKIAGLLGADVLAKFGRMTIDYRRSTMTLGGPAPRGGKTFTARIVRAKGETFVAVRVAIHGRSFAYLVDTGAGSSTIDSRLAASLGLKSAGPKRTISAVNCKTTVQPVRIDRWTVGSVTLPAVVASSQRSSLLDTAQIAGLIGGNVFARYGRVSIDFRTGRVTLG